MSAIKDKLLIVPDVHLGKGISIGRPGSGANLNSRIKDQIFLLDWILEKAVENNVVAIILSGDIFEDYRPYPNIIQIFMTWLKKCEKAKKSVYIVAGNHDTARTGIYTVSALDIVPAVELPYANVYKNVDTVHFNGVSVTFLPFRDRRMLDSDTPEQALEMVKKEFAGELDKIPEGNVKSLVGHFTLKDAIYVGDEIDDLMNEIVCPLDMFAGYDYVWMGHIHNPQVLSTNPHIAHIGSMDLSDFSKSELHGNPKIIVIYDAETNTHQEILLPTRQLRKIDVEVPLGKDTTDYVINEIHSLHTEKSLAEAIIKLDIKLEGPEAASSDRDKIRDYIINVLKAHYICNFTESRSIVVISPQNQVLFDNNMNVSGAIDSWLATLTFDEENEKDLVHTFMHECFEEFKVKHDTNKA